MAANQKINDAILTGSSFFEWTHQRLNGENFQGEVLLTSLELNGKIVIQATVRDITEKKLIQKT
jgi:hypothetical protein